MQLTEARPQQGEKARNLPCQARVVIMVKSLLSYETVWQVRKQTAHLWTRGNRWAAIWLGCMASKIPVSLVTDTGVVLLLQCVVGFRNTTQDKLVWHWPPAEPQVKKALSPTLIIITCMLFFELLGGSTSYGATIPGAIQPMGEPELRCNEVHLQILVAKWRYATGGCLSATCRMWGPSVRPRIGTPFLMPLPRKHEPLSWCEQMPQRAVNSGHGSGRWAVDTKRPLNNHASSCLFLYRRFHNACYAIHIERTVHGFSWWLLFRLFGLGIMYYSYDTARRSAHFFHAKSVCYRIRNAFLTQARSPSCFLFLIMLFEGFHFSPLLKTFWNCSMVGLPDYSDLRLAAGDVRHFLLRINWWADLTCLDRLRVHVVHWRGFFC